MSEDNSAIHSLPSVLPSDPSSSSPPPELKSRLEMGLSEMVSQVPPKYRAVLRQSLPHLQTSLRNTSNAKLGEVLRGIRGMIDNLLGEADGHSG